LSETVYRSTSSRSSCLILSMYHVRLPLWLLATVLALSGGLFTDNSSMGSCANMLAIGAEKVGLKLLSLFDDSAAQAERQEQKQQEQLLRPKDAIREQAELSMRFASAGNVAEDRKVLDELQTVGFQKYLDPVFFIVDDEPGKVKAAAKATLRNVPEATRNALAEFFENADMAESMTTFYKFGPDGMGEFTKVVYKVAKVNGKKAIALLPYGVKFETAKVVDHYEYLTEPVTRIVTEEERVLMSDGGWFSKAEYGIAKKEKVVNVGDRKTQKPVFKQHILDMRRQEAMLRALEFEANQQVLLRLQ